METHLSSFRQAAKHLVQDLWVLFLITWLVRTWSWVAWRKRADRPRGPVPGWAETAWKVITKHDKTKIMLTDTFKLEVILTSERRWWTNLRNNYFNSYLTQLFIALSSCHHLPVLRESKSVSIIKNSLSWNSNSKANSALFVLVTDVIFPAKHINLRWLPWQVESFASIKINFNKTNNRLRHTAVHQRPLFRQTIKTWFYCVTHTTDRAQSTKYH